MTHLSLEFKYSCSAWWVFLPLILQVYIPDNIDNTNLFLYHHPLEKTYCVTWIKHRDTAALQETTDGFIIVVAAWRWARSSGAFHCIVAKGWIYFRYTVFNNVVEPAPLCKMWTHCATTNVVSSSSEAVCVSHAGRYKVWRRRHRQHLVKVTALV